MKNTSFAEDFGVFLIRAIVGIAFLYHGSQKVFGLFGGPGLEGFVETCRSHGFPLPWVSGIAAAFTELIGGLALVTGAFMQPIMVPLSFTMFVAAFYVHWGDGFGGMELALVYAFITAGLALLGPGRFAWRPRQAKS